VAYIKTVWVNDAAPAVDATNLNKIEQGIFDAHTTADNAATTLSALPRITTSALSGGPPASPADKDIWIATNVEGSGKRWMFQYDASWVTDAYKWKFIGGSELVFQQDGSITVAATASPAQGASGTGTVAAVTYNPTRSGIYLARHNCTLSNTTSVAVSVFLSMGGTNYSGDSSIPVAAGFTPGLAEDEQACSGGSSIVPTYSNNNSGTLTVTVRRLVVVPTRII
jgi:hypothetical protein